MTHQELMELAIAEQKKLVMATRGFRDILNPGDAVKTDTIDIAQGLYGYSLEQPAKQLIPFLPAWVQSLPRNVIGTGNVHQYKRITGVALTGKSTAAEGARGNAASIATDAPTVAMGNLSSGVFNVSMQAQYAAGTFEDVLARATTLSLLQGRRSETAHILGGNVTALGAVDSVTGVTTALSTSIAGNLVTGQTYYVYIKQLTAMAMQKAILAQCVQIPAVTTHAVQSVGALSVNSASVVGIDQTDGYSVESTVTNSGSATTGDSLTISWVPSPKAAGYAIFVGSTADGGTGIAKAFLQCVIGSQANVVLTKYLNTGVAGVTGDNSADANDFPGLLALLNASGSGAYINAVSGTLTPDSGNGITQINTMLTSCYLSQLGIDEGYLVMGIGERQNLSRALGAGTATSIGRYIVNLPGSQDFTGGMHADHYKHPVTGNPIPVVTDVNLSHGMILWIPTKIPYIAADVPSPLAMFLNYDWMLLPYAVTAPKREYEAVLRGGLACYLPPAFGLLYDIYFG